MDQALLNLVNGIPIAAAVLYIWRISDKNHMDEIARWRETIEKKDQVLSDMQQTINDLITEIKTLTFITQNYVIGKRKNTAGKQDQQPKAGSGRQKAGR